jgi:hypothetical protein
VVTGWEVTTEHFYIFKMSIEVGGDEYAGSKLEIPCPFFGTWGFSACGDIQAVELMLAGFQWPRRLPAFKATARNSNPRMSLMIDHAKRLL